jgi:hypothetical protein
MAMSEYEDMLRQRVAGLPPLQKVMIELDVALTGHAPTEVVRQYHHYPVSLEHWIKRDGFQLIWYLSDSGYSRVVWNEENGTLFLTDNSRREVKANWDAALPQRQAVENELKAQWQAMGGVQETLCLVDAVLEGAEEGDPAYDPAYDRFNALYNRLYRRADKIVRQDNPCQIQKDAKGNVTCVSSRLGKAKYGSKPSNDLCCGGCNQLGPEGCKAEKPLTCKSWVCPTIWATNPKVHRKLSRVSRAAMKHNFWKFRGDKTASMQQALSTKHEAQRLVDSLLNESPEMKTLKKNKVKLDPEEREQAMKAGATWHPGNHENPTCAVWKAVVNGKTWYVCNTHRCYQARPTLKGAISAFDYVKTTS